MAKRKGADPKKDIERIVKAITDNADRIRVVTFNTVKGQLARRIWNNGKASDGTRIGSYTIPYKKLRNEAGFRIDTADLELTGTLRRSLIVGEGEGRTQLGMADQLEPKVKFSKGKLTVTGTSNFNTVENAIVQEKNFNKEIFAPSKEELDRGEKTVVKELNLVVQKSLRQS